MIRLAVPGLLLYRDVVLRVIAASCKLARVQSGRQHDDSEAAFGEQVVSAVGEAFNNIALHGYSPAEVGDVRIEIAIDADCMTIRLIDEGKSFDPAHVPAPDLASLPEHHMGLFIMRSFMDEVTYRPGRPPSSSNVLTLTKRF